MFNFDSKFFEKHQKGLLFIANRWYLSWILGLNRLPNTLKGKRIDKITSSSVHHIIGEKNEKYEVETEFFSSPRFAEALAFSLSPFCYFQNVITGKMVWKFSPVGVIGCLLIALFPKLIGGYCFFGTTSNFYPDADPESTSVDGQIGINGASTWAGARDASSGDGAFPSDTLSWIMCERRSDTLYYINRFFSLFDTHILTANASISSSTYNLYYTGTKDLTGYSDSIHLVQTNPASNTDLTNSDFSRLTFTSGGSQSTFSSAGYFTITLNATALTWISKTDITKLGAIMSKDLTNTDPSTSGARNYLQVRCADYTGSTSDPYISVTYTITASTFIPKIIIF